MILSEKINAIYIIMRRYTTNTSIREPAEKIINVFFKENKNIGKGDRSFIAEIFFQCIRRRPFYPKICHYEENYIINIIKENIYFCKNILTNYDMIALKEIISQSINIDHTLREVQIPFIHQLSIASFLLSSFPSEEYASKEWEEYQKRAPMDLRANTARINRETLRHQLAIDDVHAHPTSLSPYGLRIPSSSFKKFSRPCVYNLPLFKEGLFEIQDEGAQYVLLHFIPLSFFDIPRLVVDICAGNGGKTLAIAAMMDVSTNVKRHTLYACDIEEKRLNELKRRYKRAQYHTELKAITLKNSDTKDNSPLHGLLADFVIMDVPCSGSGTLRRRIDVLENLSYEELKKYRIIQNKIFKKAITITKIGGYLLYITCSFIKYENEENIAYFLKEYNNIRLVKPFLHLSPLQSETDGFFGALLQKFF